MSSTPVGTEQSTYTTKRGVVYSYHIAWSTVGNTCVWEAVVTRDGKIVSTPKGKFHEIHHLEPFDLATAQLQYVIESRLDAEAQTKAPIR